MEQSEKSVYLFANRETLNFLAPRRDYVEEKVDDRLPPTIPNDCKFDQHCAKKNNTYLIRIDDNVSSCSLSSRITRTTKCVPSFRFESTMVRIDRINGKTQSRRFEDESLSVNEKKIDSLFKIHRDFLRIEMFALKSNARIEVNSEP